ncbi:NUDIX domain-containing protein [Thalassolituus marinus]|uniref:8-oxo-dGTP diphosphatase n=2 Tax=Thalassolituus marinus TaxID=671053 RepID=A0ABS7ZT97_9GAMM|nr:NUDIX domain-containing protein [Thalassolituus marinus]
MHDAALAGVGEFAPCVSFILLCEGQVLLEQRRADKAVDPGLIMIPGGHMEAGESQWQTLLREVAEELALTVTRASYICSLIHRTTETQLLHYYLVHEWQGDLCAQEAERVFWSPLASADELITGTDCIALAEALRLYG